MSTLQDIQEGLDSLNLDQSSGVARESNPRRSRPMSVHFPTQGDIATTLGGGAYSVYSSVAPSASVLNADWARAANKRDKRRSMQLPSHSSSLASHQLTQFLQSPVTQSPHYVNSTIPFPGMALGSPTTHGPAQNSRTGRSRPPSKSMSFPLRPQPLPMVGGQYLRHHPMPLHSPPPTGLGNSMATASGLTSPLLAHAGQLPMYLPTGLDPSPYGRSLALQAPGPDEIPTAVVIKNIAFSVKREVLLQTIVALDIPMPYALNYHYEGGVFRGLAFANFRTPEETMIVFATLNGFDLAGRKLKVEYKRMLPADVEAAKQEARLAHRNSISAGSHYDGPLASANGGGESPLAGTEPPTPTSDIPINLDDPKTRELYDQIASFRHDKSRRELELMLTDDNEADLFAVVAAIVERFGLISQVIFSPASPQDSPNAANSPSSSPHEPKPTSRKAGVRLTKPTETVRTDNPRVRHHRASISGMPPVGNVSTMPKPNRGRLTSESHIQSLYPSYMAHPALYGQRVVPHGHLTPATLANLGYPYNPYTASPEAYLASPYAPMVAEDLTPDANGRHASGRFRSVSFSVGPRPTVADPYGRTQGSENPRLPNSSGSPSTPTSSSPAFQGYPSRVLNSSVVIPTRQPRGPDLSQNFVLRLALLNQMTQVGLTVSTVGSPIHGQSQYASAHGGNDDGFYSSPSVGQAGTFV
ncbi:Peptidyl-prolyl cis-trans isomerase pin4 [Dimargaris cristalligena]|nr:Peptidyl-prolyl cis-trans isomerase pin4 [Dimargaris cristalligena]